MQVKTIEVGSQSFKVAGLESNRYLRHPDLTNGKRDLTTAGAMQ
jgi:hypothetical protein